MLICVNLYILDYNLDSLNTYLHIVHMYKFLHHVSSHELSGVENVLSILDDQNVEKCFFLRMSGISYLCNDLSRIRKTIVYSMSHVNNALLLCKIENFCNYFFLDNFNHLNSW